MDNDSGAPGLESNGMPEDAAEKRQVTIRMRKEVILYFKKMAEETGIPYQSLINLYLRDCVRHERRLHLNWAS